MEHLEYPKMIYKGGIVGPEWRIVADRAEQESSRKDGFWSNDEAAAPVTAPRAPQGKEELIAALESAGKHYDKRWGVDKLRAALEA